MKNESIRALCRVTGPESWPRRPLFFQNRHAGLAEAMKRPKLACETEPPSLPPACPPRGTRPTKSLPPVIA